MRRREGEEGDNFYVIESGTWAALKAGVTVFQYEGHGAFGELALLYNCPRAATVQVPPLATQAPKHSVLERIAAFIAWKHAPVHCLTQFI